MQLTEDQQQKIEEVGRKRRLKFILLHGSYATNKMKPDSDLDIALLGEKPIELEELLDIYSDLAEIFGDNPRRELDIKSLHKADPLFCYQVAKDSQLLYGDLTDFNEFRAHAFSNYFDSKDLFHLEKIIMRAIDINQHMIAELGRGDERVRGYEDTFYILSQFGIYSEEFAKQIAPSAGLRNRLVHEYNNTRQDRSEEHTSE